MATWTTEAPFAEVLAPIVFAARARVPVGDVLSKPATAAFERSLIDRLSRVTARLLYREFLAVRPAGARLAAALSPGTAGSGDAGSEHYRAFVDRLAANGIESIGTRYPVARSLIETIADQWVAAVTELLARLHADRELLASHFGVDAARVLGARASLSDPHRGGRTVCELELEGGRVFYKPRSLALEGGFTHFVDWCTARGAPAGLRAARVLERDGYGWMEAVAADTSDAADPQRFYENAGALTAALHLLRATDCHSDNLIARGDHLVLIDAEALLQPEVPYVVNAAELGYPGTGELSRRVNQSVGRTGMLPMWTVDPGTGTLSDESALGAVAGNALHRATRWEGVGRDDVRPVLRTTPSPDAPARPNLRGDPRSIAPSADALHAGFAAMYDFLLAHRAELLAPESPLERFRDRAVRFVHRPTRTYGAVLERALAPEVLADRSRFESALAILARPIAADDVPRQRVVAAEIASLRSLDVPYFEADTGSVSLDVGDGTPISDWFEQPSFASVRATLEGMGDADRALQLAIVRGMALAHGGRTSQSSPANAPRRAPIAETPAETLFAAADRIAEEIAKRALRDGDGSAFWLGFGAVRGSDRLQFVPSGESVYDGNLGIALFLSAYDQVRGGGQYAALTRDSLASVLRYLRLAEGVPSQWFAERMGLGGATGLGSLVYGFTRLGVFDAARCAMRLMSPALIAADRALDVLDGSAGAILGLLALHSATGDATALAVAEACGRHLLDVGRKSNGLFVWKTIGERPLAGFSHGAAGIALALARLAAATSDSQLEVRCSDAVGDALAYEAGVFDTESGTWRDLRDGSPGGERTSWCHGAAGIGLARLGLLGVGVGDRSVVDGDIERALVNTRFAGELDHLCCGEAGRIEFLIDAGRRLERAELADAARARAGAMAADAIQHGSYRLFPPPATHVFHAGFFQGLAGIGYTMLRAAGADLPSVLLWE